MNWKWNEINESVAVSALRDKSVPNALCCDAPEIHIHAHSAGLWKEKGRCSAWIWCSHCGAYDHLDGIRVHIDWKNNPEVDFSKVTATPVYLETVKESVDRHFKRFLDN